MRVACSLILSSSLLFPSAALPLTQTTQDKNAKQAAQEPQSVAPVVKQPLAFGLEDSTPVKLRINRNISSADAQVNETVDFEVLEEVKVHDVVVIPRGGTAWATVTEAQPKRRMGRAGKLNINIDNVRLTSGEDARFLDKLRRLLGQVKRGRSQARVVHGPENGPTLGPLAYG